MASGTGSPMTAFPFDHRRGFHPAPFVLQWGKHMFGGESMAWVEKAHGQQDREERYEQIKNKLSDLRARIMEEWDFMDNAPTEDARMRHQAKIEELREKFARLSEIFKELWPDD